MRPALGQTLEGRVERLGLPALKRLLRNLSSSVGLTMVLHDPGSPVPFRLLACPYRGPTGMAYKRLSVGPGGGEGVAE